MEIGETLAVTTRAQWRAWLKKHHRTAREIWLVYHTKASGRPFIPYDYAVEEALCFGWIDSTVKRHGPESRAQRFSPRRRGSKLSETNRERVRRLSDAGRMTPAGWAAIGSIDRAFSVPTDILGAIRADRQTRDNFEAFPEHYKRIRVGWIDAARGRPEVFEQRLRYFLKMTKQNKQFGMVR